MSFSRRDFIKVSSLTAVAAGFLPGAINGQSVVMPDGGISDALSFQNAGAFKNHIGSEFSFVTDNSAARGFLVSLENLPVSIDRSTPRFARRLRRRTKPECFSLTFKIVGSPDTLEQATYTVAHPALGHFQLFMVPGENRQAGERLLTAVINRL